MIGKRSFAPSAVVDHFRDRCMALGRTSSGTLYWNQVKTLGFVRDSVYCLCCDDFAGGSKDPRFHSQDFHRLVSEVRALVMEDGNAFCHGGRLE
mmetsp:Transcript_44119/g.137372  ORF Transcript_44119/g.137372 Transcript_44119/m.137372 type:complete len:94 (+) Transcript_44119:293-574(+)